MTEQAAAISTRDLSKSERNELTRIVKARFKLLRAQAKARIAEIVAAEKRAEQAQHEELIQKYQDEAKPILEQMGELQRELNDILNRAREDGLGGDGQRFYAYDRYDRAGIYDIDARTKLVVTEIERVELEKLEELLTSELQSSTAQAFLGTIPSIESLVEQGTQALEAAEPAAA